MADSEPTRFFVAGAGFIARFHARALDAVSGQTTLSVADPDPDARSAFAEKFPAAETYADTEAMLEQPARESDILIVATPPLSHHDLAVAGLESGRHVLCEKPLALDTAEARSMVETARASDRLLGSCACRYLGTPTTARVRDLLDRGDLGDPYHATWISRTQRGRPGIENNDRHWALDTSVNGGGVLMDSSPYDFAALNELLRPDAVTVSSAWTERPETRVELPEDVVYDVEHHAGATLRYHRSQGPDVTVTFEQADCTHGREQSTYELEGTRGAVRWEWKATEGTVTHAYDVDGEVETTTETVSDTSVAMHDKPVVYFDRVVRGETAPIPLDGEAGFVFACLRAVYEAAERGEPRRVAQEDWT